LEIIYCDASHSELWDSFLMESGNGSFYHRFGWKQINEKSFGHETFYLAALKDGKITGVFPLVYIRSRMFGNILCSMPFVNFGGLCALDTETSNLLLHEAIRIIDKYKMDYLEMRQMENIDNELPTSTLKVSLTINLNQDPDILWSAFKTKHRTEIRRAYKNGVTVKMGSINMLDDFYGILSEKWRNLGTPIYPKNYFDNIICGFSESVKIFVVYHESIPVAGAFNGYYKKTVEGMWAGSIDKHRRLNPNYVLYWEMIKHACENGFKTFHLGRSSVESGGEDYKKKWNALPRQLYWQYILGRKKQIPQLNVNNPKYKLAIQAWRQLPVKVTNFIGPFIARNIP